MHATTVGVQRRADSLAQLEHDRNALSRQPDDRNKRMLVSLHFFLAEYHHEYVGKYRCKTFSKIRANGRTEAAYMAIGQSCPNEKALLTLLWKELHVRDDHTCGIAVSEWAVCTTIDTGTSHRSPSWNRPAWHSDGPLMLSQYKDLVHDADGKELDARRTAYIQKSKNSRLKVLGVFVVHEVPELTDDDNAGISEQPVATGTPDTALSLPETSTRRRRSAFIEFDDEDLPPALDLTGVSAPPSSALSVTPSSTAGHSSIGESTPRPNFVELPSLARSSLALASTDVAPPDVSQAHVTPKAQGGPRQAAPRLPWIPSPEPGQDDLSSHPPDSDDGQELFVRPADLHIKQANSPESGHTGMAKRAGPVEEEAPDDIVVEVVGKKRKRAKVGSAKPDGGPKYSTRGAKRAKPKPSPPAQEVATAAPRQSGRIQARGGRAFPL